MQYLTWLTPARRKAIHAAAAAVAAIAVALNVTDPTLVGPWLEVLAAALAFVSMVLAAIAARRADWTAIYAGAAALIAAVAAAGLITEQQSGQALAIAEQVIVLLPLLAALTRTDTSTPTGEPVQEYHARHAAPLIP